MLSYYASSSEPANVRGQTVYIQYSNRQEIGNYNKSAGGIAGNVLIVTLEGVQRSDVSIEVIHAVSPIWRGIFLFLFFFEVNLSNFYISISFCAIELLWWWWCQEKSIEVIWFYSISTDWAAYSWQIVVVTYSAWIRRPMFPRRKFSLSAFCIGRYTTCTLFSFFWFFHLNPLDLILNDGID